MQARDRVGFWLWNAIFGGLIALYCGYKVSHAFYVAAAVLVAYNCLRALLVYRRRIKMLTELKELRKKRNDYHLETGDGSTSA